MWVDTGNSVSLPPGTYLAAVKQVRITVKEGTDEVDCAAELTIQRDPKHAGGNVTVHLTGKLVSQ